MRLFSRFVSTFLIPALASSLVADAAHTMPSAQQLCDTIFEEQALALGATSSVTYLGTTSRWKSIQSLKSWESEARSHHWALNFLKSFTLGIPFYMPAFLRMQYIFYGHSPGSQGWAIGQLATFGVLLTVGSALLFMFNKFRIGRSLAFLALIIGLATGTQAMVTQDIGLRGTRTIGIAGTDIISTKAEFEFLKESDSYNGYLMQLPESEYVSQSTEDEGTRARIPYSNQQIMIFDTPKKMWHEVGHGHGREKEWTALLKEAVNQKSEFVSETYAPPSYRAHGEDPLNEVYSNILGGWRERSIIILQLATRSRINAEIVRFVLETSIKFKHDSDGSLRIPFFWPRQPMQELKIPLFSKETAVEDFTVNILWAENQKIRSWTGDHTREFPSLLMKTSKELKDSFVQQWNFRSAETDRVIRQAS